jgi:hypothetical protein
MDRKGLRGGHFVALVGALAAFASLFRPWYAIEVPAQLRDLLSGTGRVGQDPGLLGQMARSLAAALPSEVSASGWRELEGADVALCVAALAVVVLVLGAAGALGGAVRVDAGAAGSLIAAAGGASLALVVAHLVHRPGGAAAADYVHVAQGLWIALAGSAAMLVGGLAAAAQPDAAATRTAPAAFPRLDPELPPVFAAPAPGAPTSSVPPPRP